MTRFPKYYIGIAIFCFAFSLMISVIAFHKWHSESSESRSGVSFAVPVSLAFTAIGMLAAFAGREIMAVQKRLDQIDERFSVMEAKSASPTNDV